ncbi:cytochrome c oxidase accessory protein CcoG [Paremcibacter congregatus]|uniref:cytochrome c oxidase accessory protein CcoG n=1 Tax=Paremcibacter congregatus TaxID=2043170 RepID=UPI0030ED5F59|tara:strand:+ start:4430 stop:5953 length:1524 start_codon:yes stop_codon:yes gene_type:complete
MAYTPPETNAPQSAKSEKIIPHHKVKRAKVEAVNKAEKRSLYAARKKIHPKRATGTFRTIKWWVMAVTLSIYYFSPWIRWDRGPGIPDQAILVDITNSRFYFFFIEIWPQEVYYITGLMILAAIGLFLVTSTAGRIWCGYTCPQTVWIDLFLVVERFFEGDRNARIKLDKAPWSASKLAKRVAKHAVWIVIAVCTGGAWVFYMNDAPTLIMDLYHFDAPLTTYFWICLLTATTYLLGGFAREQVCTYMCPWPRIQGVMMDEETLSVMYRHDRGEPRAPHKKGDSWDGRGDCVQCRQCVVVCPAGIDIRDGMQLECIQCSLCIDACDEVMEKIGRPKGLIAYDSLANFDRRAEKEPEKIRIIRPRTLLYTILMILIGGYMLHGLMHRADLEVNILRDRNPLFVTLSSGDIRNGYTVKILNKSHDIRKFTLSVTGLDHFDMRVEGVTEHTADGLPIIEVNRDRLRSVKVYLAVPKEDLTDDSLDITFIAKDMTSDSISENSTTFKGPKK